MSSLKDLASLIMVPSLYKDGRLDTVKPLGNGILHPDATGNHDGTDASTPPEGNFTFSRGSNLAATRVDVNGLIEKGRENLITYSQDATQWSSQKSTRVSATEADPFGGNSAAEYAVSSITGGSYFYRTISPSLSSGQVFTGSIYVKNVDQRYVQLTFGTAAFGSSQYQNFDLQTGTKGTGTGMIDSTITSVGNDWYRISITKATISSGASGLVPCFVPSESATRLQAPAVVGRSFQAFGFQLEQGLVATDYIETGTSAAQSGILEDMPRLDYSGGASCPSLLLEPQRSNLITQSEYFGDWTAFGGIQTITDNYAVSPEGVQNAARVELERSPSLSRIQLSVSGTSNGVAFVYSVYLKANSGSPYVYLQAGPNFSTAIEVTNEWERYDLVGTASGGTTTCIIGISDSVSGTTETADILVYGAQLESSASYPTSYIPTYGSSVTRSADYMQVIPTDLLGSDSGTWFMELNDMTFDIAGTQVPTIYLGDSTTNCLAIEPKSAANNKGIFLVKEESNVSTTLYDFTISGKTKFCFVWSGTTLKVFRDGVQRYSATNFTQPANWDSFVFNHGTREAFSEIPSILLFPTALTDSECIALTTL